MKLNRLKPNKIEAGRYEYDGVVIFKRKPTPTQNRCLKEAVTWRNAADDKILGYTLKEAVQRVHRAMLHRLGLAK